MSVRRPERIVVTGSECTGKTTLARQLSDRLGGVLVPEFARSYAESIGRPLSAADVEPIARGQIAQEDGTPARPLLVLDTDLVSTVVYARYYYGDCPPWIVAEATQRLGDIYLLCDIDIPWVPDGVRDQPDARAELHSRFHTTLTASGARTAVISGHADARLAAALGALERA
jgi:nicotinamide riboside kinase